MRMACCSIVPCCTIASPRTQSLFRQIKGVAGQAQQATETRHPVAACQMPHLAKFLFQLLTVAQMDELPFSIMHCASWSPQLQPSHRCSSQISQMIGSLKQRGQMASSHATQDAYPWLTQWTRPQPQVRNSSLSLSAYATGQYMLRHLSTAHRSFSVPHLHVILAAWAPTFASISHSAHVRP